MHSPTFEGGCDSVLSMYGIVAIGAEIQYHNSSALIFFPSFMYSY